MSARVVVTGVLLVFVLLIVVFMVEMLIPLSVYADFNESCRIALIRMEAIGGMTTEIEEDLSNRLRALNLTDIIITGTQHAKYGEVVRLQVTVAMKNHEMVSLFQRVLQYRYVTYDKTSISRRIIK
ncbi:MAG TPA: hypothetical protein DDZ89_17170 [Clostridiales bacterium]|nr:hypothetical protein [Clostridiales bacterium]